MKVPEFHRLLLADVPGAPAWLRAVLDAFNRPLAALAAATRGSLTIGDNVQGFYADLRFTTRSDYVSGTAATFDTIKLACSFPARAVLLARIELVAPAYTPIALAVQLDWIQLEPAVLSVRFVSGLAASSTYAMRLLVLP